MASRNNKSAYGVKEFFLDTEADLPKVLRSYLTPGSTAFIIDTSVTYMLNHDKEWVKINTGSGNSGGGSGEGGGNSDNIYDGGGVQQGYPSYDGGGVKPQSLLYDGGGVF